MARCCSGTNRCQDIAVSVSAVHSDEYRAIDVVLDATVDPRWIVIGVAVCTLQNGLRVIHRYRVGWQNSEPRARLFKQFRHKVI